MKYLVIVRHGAYRLDGMESGLTEIGRGQIRETCKKLASFSGQNTFMLVSQVERAVQSAEIIAAELGIPPHCVACVQGLDRVDSKTVDIVHAKCDLVDVLVVVGHEVTVRNLPAYLEKNPELLGEHPVEKGGGVIMNWETKALEWF